MDAKNKIAIVTGASSGIGRSSALALLKAGFNVVLAGRRREKLEETAKMAGDLIDNTLIIATDVSRPESVKALFDKTKTTYGRLDLLFNNAGIGAPGVPLEELPFENWKAVVETNITGVFLCTQEAFKIMKNQKPMGGRIINNGSISAHVPRPNSAPYTASKHAVSGLTKSAALDGRPFNIACGQIDIGNALTELSKKMTKDGVKQADGSVIVEPSINVEHVAQAIVYMAGLPLDTNVLSLTVMATQMPYVGRG